MSPSQYPSIETAVPAQNATISQSLTPTKATLTPSQNPTDHPTISPTTTNPMMIVEDIVTKDEELNELTESAVQGDKNRGNVQNLNADKSNKCLFIIIIIVLSSVICLCVVAIDVYMCRKKYTKHTHHHRDNMDEINNERNVSYVEGQKGEHVEESESIEEMYINHKSDQTTTKGVVDMSTMGFEGMCINGR